MLPPQADPPVALPLHRFIRVVDLMALILPTLLAFLISAALVPVVRAMSRRCGLVDRPDQVRKLQRVPISLGGGVAVYLSVVAVLIGLLLAEIPLVLGLPERVPQRWIMLMLACGVLLVVGLLDDAIGIRGRQKLLLQLLTVGLVVGSGTVVQSLQVFGLSAQLGLFAVPVTMIWLLAAINALNLIDGADGFASTAGAVISGGLALLCWLSGAPLAATVAASLAGALAGFLLYNRPPATIYLGDAGSMVIGLCLGTIALWSSLEGTALHSVAPLVVMAIPLFDIAVAVLRRSLTGRSIYTTDRGHMHHRLLGRFSPWQALALIATLCATTAAGAVLGVHWGQPAIALGAAVLVLGLLVGSGWFGAAELRMFGLRMAQFVDSLVILRSDSESPGHQRAVRLQGQRCWEAIWNPLVDLAVEQGLARLRLDVGIAWMQEGYHGLWRRAAPVEKSEQASLKIPIFVNHHLVGTLEATCYGDRADVTNTLALLVERAGELGHQIGRLIEPETNRVAGDSGRPHGVSVTQENEVRAHPAVPEAEQRLSDVAPLVFSPTCGEDGTG